jgi:predicted lipoprotein with Yx(FWY)xxD motif
MNDKKPGDATGEGVGKVWYILKVPPYSVMLSTDKALGNYLVDGKGMTLYWFTRDSPATSEGSGARNANWPAFAPSSFTVPSALDGADFKMITRGDGTKQATFKGYPLYYFVKDLKRGDIIGQDVGKVWYVIDPAKFPVQKM